MMLDADCAEIGRDKEVESLGCEKFDGWDKNGQIEMRPGAPGVIQNEVTGTHQHGASIFISQFCQVHMLLSYFIYLLDLLTSDLTETISNVQQKYVICWLRIS